MDEIDKQEVKEVLQGQHSIIADLSRTVAGLQFSVLALAASATNPVRILEEVDSLKDHLSKGMKQNKPELYEAVLFQLDLLAQRVKEAHSSNGDHKP